ncbi:hypothetical protein BH09PAT4_BH09PAT4_00430 [soil metagenome]
MIKIKETTADKAYARDHMVLVLANNTYTLSELLDGGRLLSFGRKFFRWDTSNDGSMYLTRVPPGTKTRKLLHRGNYWLFEVTHNERFSPGIHLSMVGAQGEWEAYIISPVLPAKIGHRCIIQPTDERIAYPGSRTAKK